MAEFCGTEDDYTNYLLRKYGGGGQQQDEEDSERSYATTSVATRERRPPTAPPPRALTAAQRLSRNRAAKRAASDVTLHSHLSTLYHMNRRIYEMYSKSGVAQQGGASSPSSASSASTSRASSRPSSAPSCAFQPPPQTRAQHQQQRGVAVRLHHTPQPQLVATTARGPSRRPEAAPPPPPPLPPPLPPPPRFVQRHVQNTAMALKAAILDEVVEHRIYDSQRLKALFRSYLKLNAGEAFYPTLGAVVEELKRELGVA